MGVFELLHRISELTFYYIDKARYKNGWNTNTQAQAASLNYQKKLGYDLVKNKNNINKIYSSHSDELNLTFNNSKYFKSISLPESFDLRFYWGSQRFDQLVVWSLNSTDEYNIYQYLDEWMKKNPPLIGVNYISTMECAIRSLNLYASLCICQHKNILTHKLERKSALFFQVNYEIIKHRISKFSSRGNHTIFEYAGLSICAFSLGLKSAEHWLNKAINEFDFQTNEDGSGVEQSSAYHLFNIEVIYLLEHYFHREITNNSKKLKAALEFIKYFQLKEGILRIGDSDSSALFTKAFLNLEQNDKHQTQYNKNFSDCGITILKGKKFNCTFKYGKLGLPPLYAHGHYDFLSTIITSSKNVLITADSQTYLYNSKYRKDFRSSEYHSMPTFGEDDINQNGNFSWQRNSLGTNQKSINGWISASYCRKDNIKITRSIKIIDDDVWIIDKSNITEKNQAYLKTNWLTLEKDCYFHIFTIDRSNKINKPHIEKNLHPGSAKYGEIKENQILELVTTARKGERILTVISSKEKFELPRNTYSNLL